MDHPAFNLGVSGGSSKERCFVSTDCCNLSALQMFFLLIFGVHFLQIMGVKDVSEFQVACNNVTCTVEGWVDFASMGRSCPKWASIFSSCIAQSQGRESYGFRV